MYTKLFSSITDSTIWREPNHVRLLWITMLAKCDSNGIVWASVPGLADAARISLPECQEALKTLSSPDEWSRSRELDGRRIVEIDGGWQLVNHDKYKKIRNSDERREYKRLKAREYRSRVDKNVDNVDKMDSVDPSDQIRSDQIKLNHKEKIYKKESLFDSFWLEYPRRENKQGAIRAWNKNKCDSIINEILAALKIQKSQSRWLADNGKFIPYASSWLNGRRWEDEIANSPIAPPKKTREEEIADLRAQGWMVR